VLQKRDGRSHSRQAAAGEITLIPEQTPYTCSQEQASQYLALQIGAPLIQHMAGQLEIAWRPLELIHQFAIEDTILQSMIVALQREALSPNLGSALYTESLTNQLLIHVLRTYAAGLSQHIPGAEDPLIKEPHRLQQVIDYIHDNLGQAFTIQDLANVSHLSPYHFSRLFKQATGLPPYQYVLQQRLERAQHLLLNTSTPIIDLAIQTGFYDQNHFSEQFKRRFGITPAALRNSRNTVSTAQDFPSH
jgi:AraC family transcriptional regulator